MPPGGASCAVPARGPGPLALLPEPCGCVTAAVLWGLLGAGESSREWRRQGAGRAAGPGQRGALVQGLAAGWLNAARLQCAHTVHAPCTRSCSHLPCCQQPPSVPVLSVQRCSRSPCPGQVPAFLSPGARYVCQAQALLPSTCASQPPLLRTPCLLSVELPATNHCPCCTVLLCEQLPLLWSPITPTQHSTPHPSPALLASQIPNSSCWEHIPPSAWMSWQLPLWGSPVLCALPTRAPSSMPIDLCTCSWPPQHALSLCPQPALQPRAAAPRLRTHGCVLTAVPSVCPHLPGGARRSPVVGGHAFVAPRCRWTPRSRRSRSCLLLCTVRPCTATHPLLTAGLDSPSAHAHAVAPLGACWCHAQLTACGCHARSVQTRSWGGGGLAVGSRFFAVDVTTLLQLLLTCSFWAPACSRCATHPCSSWAHCLLCAGAHMAHIEVFTPCDRGSSSSSS